MRLLVALLIIGAASAVRALLFDGLGRGTAYLTYYPAVMLAALHGGYFSGFLATGVSACLSFFWIQRGYMTPVESLAMAAFLISCTMISCICEATHRAQKRAKLAQAKAEAANRAKSVFLSSMSHELRTPLNAILGFSGLMSHDANISTEQRKTLELINRSGEHLLSLINDVLDMTKVEAGHSVVVNAPFDLGEMVRDITNLMHGRAEEKNLELRLDQSSEFPCFARADAVKLRQVILNLVGNAIKFTSQGRVTLRLNARPNNVPQRQILIIEVEDTGIGIAPEDQSRVFEPFVQVGNSAFQKGTGLGLPIARQQVELMGGQISMESTPGRGSLFRVEVPVDCLDAADVDTVRLDCRRVTGLAPGQPEYRLLIVEDEIANWLLLRRLLEGIGFQQVRVVENGAAGVELFQTWRPHFIWMDIRMPIMDGLEATRRIRALDGGLAVKIVAITASVFKEERDNVLAAGMDDFIRKPYRPEDIYGCIARHLGAKFAYGENPTAPAVKPAGSLRSEDLAKLSPELRGNFAAAIVSLDAERISDIICRISEQNPVLGSLLMHHADQMEYTVMLQAVQTGADHEIQNSP